MNDCLGGVSPGYFMEIQNGRETGDLVKVAS